MFALNFGSKVNIWDIIVSLVKSSIGREEIIFPEVYLGNLLSELLLSKKSLTIRWKREALSNTGFSQSLEHSNYL